MKKFGNPLVTLLLLCGTSVISQVTVSTIENPGWELRVLVKDDPCNSCYLINDAAFSQQLKEEYTKITSAVQLDGKPLNGDRIIYSIGFNENSAWAKFSAFATDSKINNGTDLCGEGCTPSWNKKRSETIYEAIEKNGMTFNVEKPLRPTGLSKRASDTITKLVDGGPPGNRIDLVLMGDGYTASEQNKFDTDMSQIAYDMLDGPTFSSIKPLFNVWTIFRASSQSGIGVGGMAKNTAFGLTRDGTELRGITPKNPSAARSACKQTGQYACDYPSIIGNDLYYGGLGGEFVIATASPTSGPIVMRHELGHNLISVGEEYNNGQVYQGCNSASSLSAISWRPWLTSSTWPPVEEKTSVAVQAYPWVDLARGVQTYTFTSTGGFNRWYIRFSASGTEKQTSLIVKIDGVALNWNVRGDLDRTFYKIYSADFNNAGVGFTAGTHKLTFQSGSTPTSGRIQQLCSVEVHEYGTETTFHTSNDYIGAFPTFNDQKRKTYRPTNEGCLMRDMTSNKFCPICREGLWVSLLSQMSLIDSITSNGTHIAANLLPLGQLRQPQIIGEFYSLKWSKNGVYANSFEDQFTFSPGSADLVPGTWKLDIVFNTPEVRSKILSFTKTVTIDTMVPEGRSIPTTSAIASTSCSHPVCSAGIALKSGCDVCATKIILADAFCGTSSWDNACTSQVKSLCGITC